MPRTSTYEIPLDASLFTPNQLQAVAVGRLGFQAGTRWLRDHVCSHRTLVATHRVGLVLWAWQLDYEQPLRFTDADEMTVEVRGCLRGPRWSQLEVEMTLSGPSGVAVRTRAASVPLRLTGDEALSGRSAPLPESVVQHFPADERNRIPFRSHVPGLRARYEQAGARLGADRHAVRVHRHHCEVADQWYWPESLGFVGAAREEFIRRHGTEHVELRRALIDGVRRVDVTWLRAGQLWDLLDVCTTAYRMDEKLAFVHEIGLAGEEGSPCAVVVEQL